MKGKEKICNYNLECSVYRWLFYFDLSTFSSIFLHKKMEQIPSAVPTSPLSNQQISYHLQTQECLLLCSQGIVLISVLTCEGHHIYRLGTSSLIGRSMKRVSLLRCKAPGHCPRLAFKALGGCKNHLLLTNRAASLPMIYFSIPGHWLSVSALDFPLC